MFFIALITYDINQTIQFVPGIFDNAQFFEINVDQCSGLKHLLFPLDNLVNFFLLLCYCFVWIVDDLRHNLSYSSHQCQ